MEMTYEEQVSALRYMFKNVELIGHYCPYPTKGPSLVEVGIPTEAAKPLMTLDFLEKIQEIHPQVAEKIGEIFITNGAVLLNGDIVVLFLRPGEEFRGKILKDYRLYVHTPGAWEPLVRDLVDILQQLLEDVRSGVLPSEAEYTSKARKLALKHSKIVERIISKTIAQTASA